MVSDVRDQALHLGEGLRPCYGPDIAEFPSLHLFMILLIPGQVRPHLEFDFQRKCSIGHAQRLGYLAPDIYLVFERRIEIELRRVQACSRRVPNLTSPLPSGHNRPD